MEFKFNVNDVFKQPIVEINQNLIPPGFSGDRRALWDTLGKVSEIVNAMGEASAAAQGLSKPITTAERLRNSEHQLFFLIDQAANDGKGAVTGMLKTGKKGLYVFDKQGQHYQVSPPCILDFYVHESRQRNGLGKHLFEHMLTKEKIQPVNMAIDRPSEKLLGFLNKHYTLNSPVKQMNNFVVFDGFFPKTPEITNVEADSSCAVGKKESANGLQSFSSPYGRYAAPRPPCSMGQIIHNQTSTINKSQEATGVQSMPATNYQGVQYKSPNAIPNAAQSTPNISYGGQTLNAASNQSIGYAEALKAQYQNQVNQLNQYNMQNTQRNIAVNSGDSERYNQINQQYHNTVQPVTTASEPQFVNQYSTQNASETNFKNPQYMGNQVQYVNAAQNVPAGANTMIQADANQPIQYQQNAQPIQNYNQEYQSKVDLQPGHTSPQWQNPHTVYSQPIVQSQNYIANQQQIPQQVSPQHQMNQQPLVQQVAQQQVNHQQMAAQQMNQQHVNQQDYPNLEQRFENINEQPHKHIPPTNYPISAAMPSRDTTQTNAKMVSETQAMYQSPKATQNSNYNQMQEHSAGNYAISQHNMAPNAQTGWAQQNVYTPQYDAQNIHAGDTSPALNPQVTYSAPQIQNPGLRTPQPAVHNPSYQAIVAPPMQYNEATPPAQENDSVRGFVSNPSLQIPHPNANQQYTSVQHLPQQQFTPTYQTYDTGHVAQQMAPHAVPINQSPHFAHPQNIDRTQAGQPIQNADIPAQQTYSARNMPTTYHQAYNVPSQNLGQQPPIYQAGDAAQQHLPPAQTYSVKNVPGMRNMHQSRQDVSHDSYAALNLPRYNPVSDFVHAENTKNQGHLTNSLVDKTSPQSQERVVETGQDEVKTIREEGSLIYGYPPQYTNDVQAEGEKSHPSPKLERPRSLLIQPSEEKLEETTSNDINSKALEPIENEIEEVQNGIEEIKIEKNSVAAEKAPIPPEADTMAAGKKTPSHLTDQGYFDLKFYHNKLW